MNEKMLKPDQPETLTFKGRLLPPLPANYIEPGAHPLVVPHGAMPANPYLDDQVKVQQQGMDSEFLKLYQTPPKEMPTEFVENVIIDDFIINEARRKMQNFESYMKFCVAHPDIDPSLIPEMELFERGQSTIKESVNVVLNSELREGEFGKISHPYGYRMQYLDGFREEMNDAIESHGGVVYPTVAPYRSIKILPKVELFDNGTEYGGQRIVGFIVKYKRDYGHILVPGSDREVLRVVERQIAAYRVDEASGFDQEVLAAMHALRDEYPKRVKWDAIAKNESDEKALKDEKTLRTRLEMTGCADFIENAVQTDSLGDFVVPISTTIYGFKEQLPKPQKVDLVARAALESFLNTSLDTLPGAYLESNTEETLSN